MRKSGKIIITGASSMIGTSLISVMSDVDQSVVCISREIEKLNGTFSSINDAEKWQCHQCDLTSESLQASGLSEKLGDSTDNVLVHCAPIWLLPSQLEGLNSLGINRVIAFSSSSVDGKSQSTSQKEQEIVAMLADAEQQLIDFVNHKDAVLNVTIFRPTMIYGHGKGMNLALIAKMIQRFGFFPVVFKAKGLRQPVHADDLADAVKLAMHNPATFGKLYVLSGLEVMNYHVMVEKIFAAIGKPKRIIRLPLFMYRLLMTVFSKIANLPLDPEMANRMRDNLDFDNTDAKRDFGYAPKAFLPNGVADILPNEE